MASDPMKDTVADILRAVADDDLDRALESFADDATWFSHGGCPVA